MDVFGLSLAFWALHAHDNYGYIFKNREQDSGGQRFIKNEKSYSQLDSSVSTPYQTFRIILAPLRLLIGGSPPSIKLLRVPEYLADLPTCSHVISSSSRSI